MARVKPKMQERKKIEGERDKKSHEGLKKEVMRQMTHSNSHHIILSERQMN